MRIDTQTHPYVSLPLQPFLLVTNGGGGRGGGGKHSLCVCGRWNELLTFSGSRVVADGCLCLAPGVSSSDADTIQFELGRGGKESRGRYAVVASLRKYAHASVGFSVGAKDGMGCMALEFLLECFFGECGIVCVDSVGASEGVRSTVCR